MQPSRSSKANKWFCLPSSMPLPSAKDQKSCQITHSLFPHASQSEFARVPFPTLGAKIISSACTKINSNAQSMLGNRFWKLKIDKIFSAAGKICPPSWKIDFYYYCCLFFSQKCMLKSQQKLIFFGQERSCLLQTTNIKKMTDLHISF